MDMTPKQRFIDALNFKKPKDYVAFMELEFQIYEEYVGQNLILGYELAKLSPNEKERALRKNAEIMLITAEKAGHDAIKDIASFWEVSPGNPAYLWIEDFEDRLQLIRYLKEMGDNKYFVLGSVGANIGIPDGVHMYQFIIDIYENPDSIKETCGIVLKNAKEQQLRLVEAGADGILNACDVAFNNGTFISPQMLDQFFFPYFYQWAEDVKKLGVYSVWHTDGNISSILNKAIESGVNAIQCIDPLAGMDIIPLTKELYGKTTLIGNVDCSVLQSGTKEEIEQAVKYVVEGCKGKGGFVLSGCNAIFKGIPADNYQVMVDSRYKYGHE